MDEAVNVSNVFLPQGEMIVETREELREVSVSTMRELSMDLETLWWY
ncbi:hypothetical protein D5R40_33720 [Okeania hirsuta]|uniref:Uncharacterized protein n=1 Tax=Okeania hirsuta TaxID=1458930 RepID=A0A3N6QVP4_9CYAN|nr:hypothetical protein D5R40_33720 [Okeania hirsuta]